MVINLKKERLKKNGDKRCKILLDIDLKIILLDY